MPTAVTGDLVIGSGGDRHEYSGYVGKSGRASNKA